MPPAAGPVMFGRGLVRVDVMLDPLVGLDDARKPLRSKLLAVPALRARYLHYVRQIAERWLDWQRLEPVARLHHALIAEAVRADTKKLYTIQAFESGVSRGERESERVLFFAGVPSCYRRSKLRAVYKRGFGVALGS